MKYSYQAKTRDGTKKSGIIDARSKETVLDFLDAEELFPIEVIKIKDEGEKDLTKRNISLFKGVSMKDVAIFSRQLSIMIESNVPPAEAV
ncbi:MAG: hypothetical protein WC909_02690 [Candidatus Paceibacterota bacterium]|jgi:type II secretory pathway component PulF